MNHSDILKNVRMIIFFIQITDLKIVIEYKRGSYKKFADSLEEYPVLGEVRVFSNGKGSFWNTQSSLRGNNSGGVHPIHSLPLQ